MSLPPDTSRAAATGRPASILVLHPAPDTGRDLAHRFREEGMMASAMDDGRAATALIYSNPPDVIVIHSRMPPDGGLPICQEMKRDNVFGQMPTIMIFAPEDIENITRWDSAPIDDYVKDGEGFAETLRRVRLCLSRTERDLDANPLTRLPGNNSIMKQLSRRIEHEESFCAAYVDIDNFKAYNDCYGFTRGDEALRLTARLILNVINALNDSRTYVGHIGGDDFFFIVPEEMAERACSEITKNFDLIIPSLYDAEDRSKGRIDSVNRRGEKEQFPLMSVSIAVAVNRDGSIHHVGQVGSIVKDLKKAAKAREGSCHIIDRRDPGNRVQPMEWDPANRSEQGGSVEAPEAESTGEGAD